MLLKQLGSRESLQRTGARAESRFVNLQFVEHGQEKVAERLISLVVAGDVFSVISFETSACNQEVGQLLEACATHRENRPVIR